MENSFNLARVKFLTLVKGFNGIIPEEFSVEDPEEFPWKFLRNLLFYLTKFDFLFYWLGVTDFFFLIFTFFYLIKFEELPWKLFRNLFHICLNLKKFHENSSKTPSCFFKLKFLEEYPEELPKAFPWKFFKKTFFICLNL